MVTHENDESNRPQKFLILFIIGFFMIFAGVIILVIAAVLSGDSANFGAIVFIGWFPIVIGIGPETTWIMLFAIILAVLCIILSNITQRGECLGLF